MIGRRTVLRRRRRRMPDGGWIRIGAGKVRGRWVEVGVGVCRKDMYRRMGSKDIRLGIRRLVAGNSLLRQHMDIRLAIQPSDEGNRLQAMDIRRVILLSVAVAGSIPCLLIRLATQLSVAVAVNIPCRLLIHPVIQPSGADKHRQAMVIRRVIQLSVADRHLQATATHRAIQLSVAANHLQVMVIHPAIPLSVAAAAAKCPQEARHQATMRTHTTRHLLARNRPRLKILELDLAVES
jgi:hypothetical protein